MIQIIEEELKGLLSTLSVIYDDFDLCKYDVESNILRDCILDNIEDAKKTVINLIKEIENVR